MILTAANLKKTYDALYPAVTFDEPETLAEFIAVAGGFKNVSEIRSLCDACETKFAARQLYRVDYDLAYQFLTDLDYSHDEATELTLSLIWHTCPELLFAHKETDFYDEDFVKMMDDYDIFALNMLPLQLIVSISKWKRKFDEIHAEKTHVICSPPSEELIISETMIAQGMLVVTGLSLDMPNIDIYGVDNDHEVAIPAAGMHEMAFEKHFGIKAPTVVFQSILLILSEYLFDKYLIRNVTIDTTGVIVNATERMTSIDCRLRVGWF